MILSYFRTIVLYLVLIGVIRVMGKRQVGQMEPAEFVVTMLVANLASIPMQDGAIPLYSGLMPILTVLGVELVLSWAGLRSVALRRLLCGKPLILISSGRILQQNLTRARITLDELTSLLRQQEILDLTTVQYAILETNGTLSVFPYPDCAPASARAAGIRVEPELLPVTLVSDGRLSRENLIIAGKDEAWVDAVLAQYGADRRSTLLLTVDEAGHILWIRKEAAG